MDYTYSITLTDNYMPDEPLWLPSDAYVDYQDDSMLEFTSSVSPDLINAVLEATYRDEFLMDAESVDSDR
jgi:hypothetical protein